MWKKVLKKHFIGLLGVHNNQDFLAASQCQFTWRQTPTLVYFACQPQTAAHTLFTELPPHPIVTALPDTESTTKIFTLKTCSHKVIRETILTHLHRLTIQNNSQVHFDYQIKKSSNTLSIITVEKQKLLSHLTPFKKTKNTLYALELESHALKRFFNFFYPDLKEKTVCLFEITRTTFRWFVFSGGALIFLSTQPIAQTPIDIGASLQKLHHHYHTHYPHLPIQKILLIGELSLLTKTQISIENNLQITTELINPIQQLAISPTSDKEHLMSCYTQLAFSIGLSLRRP